MPLYEYACERCVNRFEVLVRNAGDAARVACPDCGGRKVNKCFSTFAMGGRKTVEAGSCSGGGSCSGCSGGSCATCGH